jgi:hypothetical protein
VFPHAAARVPVRALKAEDAGAEEALMQLLIVAAAFACSFRICWLLVVRDGSR